MRRRRAAQRRARKRLARGASSLTGELLPLSVRRKLRAVNPKKVPSSREYQLLAVPVRGEWDAGVGAELNGRQNAKAGSG